MGLFGVVDAEDAAKSVSCIFVRTNSDCINAHLDDWVIIAAWLSHIAEIENFGFLNLELLEEMGHAEDFVHARNESVDTSRAADFIFEIWRKFFGASGGFR